MEKLAKRTNVKRGTKLATLTDLQELSKARLIDNDTTWANDSTEVMQRKQDLDRYAEIIFWNNLTGKEGFKGVLKTTLPKFWKPEHGGTGRVSKIVKKEATNNDALLGGINISMYDKYGILGLFFIDIDNASYLKDKREKTMKKAVFIGKLFEINAGSVVPENKRYQLPEKQLAEIDSDSSESGNDENENDEIW
eukprot:scaffold217766_cov49-Attheya_sp.AAC.4